MEGMPGVLPDSSTPAGALKTAAAWPRAPEVKTDGRRAIKLSEVNRAGHASEDRAAKEAAAFISGLEHSGQAAAIVNKMGRVIAVNAGGQQRIRPPLTLRGDQLRAISRDLDGRLQAFLHALVDSSEKLDYRPIEVMVLLEAGDPSLVLRGSPIGDDSREILPDARAIVTFTDIGRSFGPPATLLSETFGLTSTETTIALAVAHGEDLQAIATRKKISIQTVRSHLKSIFTKTNTRRQLALAVLITKIEGVSGHMS
jgi:DNA-binding CsgD family transcriptional regulator